MNCQPWAAITLCIFKDGGTSLHCLGRAMKDDLPVGERPKPAQRRKRSGGSRRGRLWKHSTLADMKAS